MSNYGDKPQDGDSGHLSAVGYSQDGMQPAQHHAYNFQNIIESLNDWIWEMDKNGHITYSSPSMEGLLGYRTRELIGKSFFSMLPLEDAGTAKRLFSHHWSVRKPIDQFEHALVSCSGETLWFQTSGNPFFDMTTKTEGIRLVSRDITKSKQAAAFNKTAGTAINQLVEAIAVMDTDLTIRFVNKAFCDLFGYKEDEIIGHSLKILGEQDKDITSSQPTDVTRKLLKKDVWQGEVRRRTKSGQYIPVMISARATYDDNNEFSGFIGTYLDLRPIRNSYLELKKSLTHVIQSISRAIEERDLQRARHMDRVTDFAEAIALEMGMDLKFIEGLSLACSLHDIGKIYIPSEILNRAGRLTEHEFDMIKTHPTIGFQILKDANLPWPVADTVLQHHERMDGSGYPNKLKGSDILLEARILAVGDIVETMLADRPYRPARTMEHCITELELNRGTLYDPDVVDTALGLLREKHYRLLPV